METLKALDIVVVVYFIDGDIHTTHIYDHDQTDKEAAEFVERNFEASEILMVLRESPT